MRVLSCCVATVIALTGCAYQITAMPRDSGKIYSGEATNNQMGGGDITITIEGTQYKGKWTRTGSNDSYTVLTTYGTTSRGARTSTTGFGQTYGSGGTGKAMLSSVDGKGLRCEFAGGGSGSGGGVCVDDGGRVYDIQFGYK